MKLTGYWSDISDRSFRSSVRTKKVVSWILEQDPDLKLTLDQLIDLSFQQGIYSPKTGRRDVVQTMIRYMEISREVHSAASIQKRSEDDRNEEALPGLREDLRGREVLPLV